MRKLLLLIASIGIGLIVEAQVYDTVHVAKAGTLSTLLTPHEDSTVTNLTVTGTIDSLDFVKISSMKALKVLDLNEAACTTIPNYTFCACTGLTAITIPSSVTSIGVYAFEGCTGLTTITIPSSVTSIGAYAFGVTGLKAIIIPSSVTFIGGYAFEYCTGLTAITIPSSVTFIGDGAFTGCTGLTSVSIPSSVTYIGNDAFEGCAGLTVIYAYPVMPIDLSSSSQVFFNVPTTTCTLYVPTGSLAAYQVANQWKDFMHINGTLTGIGIVEGLAKSYKVVGNTVLFSDKESAVYSMLGVCLSPVGSMSVTLPAGVYVVQTAGEVDKIVIGR